MFTLRLFGGSLATSTPSSMMRPEVGSSKPATSRSVVVFPHPEGPRSEKNSPGVYLERQVVDRYDVREPLREAD